MWINLDKICNITPVGGPALSLQSLQEGDPSTYEDVVRLCVDMESEVSTKREGSPPVYSSYACDRIYPL